MLKMKKLIVSVFTLLLCLALAACNSGVANDPNNVGNDSYAAIVNGKAIPRQALEDSYKDWVEMYARLGAEPVATLKIDLLNTMISFELIQEMVTENNWDINAPEIDAYVAMRIEESRDIGYPSFEEYLEDMNTTENNLRLQQTLIHNTGLQVTDVSEEVMQKYYRANLSSFGGHPEAVVAYHILVADEAHARELIAELKGQGLEAFQDAARRESIDESTASSGGALGELTRVNTVTEFAEAAFSQPVGVVSTDPVMTDSGYHIIFVIEHEQETEGDFAGNRQRIFEVSLAQERARLAQEAVQERREQSEIVYAEDLDTGYARRGG
jgi:hypothetical protein